MIILCQITKTSLAIRQTEIGWLWAICTKSVLWENCHKMKLGGEPCVLSALRAYSSCGKEVSLKSSCRKMQMRSKQNGNSTWVWIRLRPRNHRICPRRSSRSAWSISSSSSARSSSMISSLPVPWPASFRNFRWLVGTVAMTYDPVCAVQLKYTTTQELTGKHKQLTGNDLRRGSA